MTPTPEQIEQVALQRFNADTGGNLPPIEWELSRDYYVDLAERQLWWVEAYLALEPQPQPEQPSE